MLVTGILQAVAAAEPSKHAAGTLAGNVLTCATAMLEGGAHVCMCVSVQIHNTKLEEPHAKCMCVRNNGLLKLHLTPGLYSLYFMTNPCSLNASPYVTERIFKIFNFS